MNTNFWVNNSNENLLAGSYDDPHNIPTLLDEDIINMLRTKPTALADLEKLYPKMLPAEQMRLDLLVQSAQSYVRIDDKDISVSFMKAYHRGSVRRGGGWMPPPLES